MPASVSPTRRCSCTAATVISRTSRSSAICATCGCTRSSKAPTRSCASSSPATCCGNNRERIMKMPRRPFYPPMKLPPDIFGLQRPTLLNFESDEETRKRVAVVEQGVLAAFSAAVDHLGEDEARRLFRHVVRRPKRGPGKDLAADRDSRLLREYDAASRRGETIAALSRRLHAEDTARKLGATEGALAAQIRKLRDERQKRQRAAAREARRWRMATRNEMPTLLSGKREK
jgi:hypothetical protein